MDLKVIFLISTGKKANQLQILEQRKFKEKKIRQKMSEGAGLHFLKVICLMKATWREISADTYKTFHIYPP